MKNPITAAILGAIGAPAPAHTITATIIGPDGTPYRATYSADMLDSLRTEPRVLDIQDDETGELIYIKPDPEDAPAAQAEADTITAHPVPPHLAREYDARTYINRTICQLDVTARYTAAADMLDYYMENVEKGDL